MIHFAWAWLWLALPLPLLLRRFLSPCLNLEQAALKVPFLADLATDTTPALAVQKSWRLGLMTAAWVMLVFAASRPQWLGEPIEQSISGRDLMLAVDLSDSMKEEDFLLEGQRVDRLTALKAVATQFIERRAGDRIGLILFGTQAYLHVPLTFDRKTVSTLLAESFIGMTEDEPRTSIGDAIGLAVKRLQQQKSSRVLILLTDGANTAGEITPLKAAELAAEHQLKIYTIGIGADEMLIRSFFGVRKVNPSKDLDEKTLTAIADKTGGRYFRARDTEELAHIYQELDKLEPVEKDKQYFRPRSELYFYPLTLALLLAGFISVYRRGEA